MTNLLSVNLTYLVSLQIRKQDSASKTCKPEIRRKKLKKITGINFDFII